MSIDGAIKVISQSRRAELGGQLGEETLKLVKLRMKQRLSASDWRKQVTKQEEICQELSMALEVGKEQVDHEGKFVKAPEGSASQLEIPEAKTRARSEEEGDDKDGEGEGEPRPNSPSDIGFGPSSKRRGVRRPASVN